MTRIVLAITGATGALYGIKLLNEFNHAGVETHLIISDSAKKTIELETDYYLSDLETTNSQQHANSNIAAPPASGSFLHDGMVVAPCSMKTLSAIANGYADNLINRAADVAIKERRKLILLVRETPLSPIHLENMLKLARLGVIIMPPVMSFYHLPNSIEDMMKQLMGRIFDQLQIETSLVKRWTG